MSILSKKIISKYLIIPISLIGFTIILSVETNTNYSMTDYSIESKLHHYSPKPDFAGIKDVNQRKISFINYVLTGIKTANEEICLQQQRIDALKRIYNKKHSLNKKQQQLLKNYSTRYKIADTHKISEVLDLLKIKIGIAPASFVLAQAILESGWGTSRFAREYNNYFGLHCFTNTCGIKAQSSNVYLEVFSNLDESVLGYYYRLNTGSKFKDFRIVRQKVNSNELPDSALFDTLENYSEIGGEAYQARLKNIIKQNNLTKYNSIKYC